MRTNNVIENATEEKEEELTKPEEGDEAKTTEEKAGVSFIDAEYQFLYEWDFQQDDEDVEIIIKFPTTFNPRSIVVTLNNEKNAIKIGIPNQISIVCGQLIDFVTGFSTTYGEMQMTVTMPKKEPGQEWPLIITDIHPDSRNIDPKSAFELSTQMMRYEDQNSKTTGLTLLLESANCGFLPAMRLFVKLFLPNNHFREEAFQMLVKGADYYDDPEMILQYGVILTGNEQTRPTSLQYFERAFNKGLIIARSYVGQIISPLTDISFPVKNAESAVDLFEKVLAQDPTEGVACHELAMCLYNGVGIEMDEERANRLQAIAIEKEPYTPPLEKVSAEKLEEIKKLSAEKKENEDKNKNEENQDDEESSPLSAVDIIVSATIVSVVSVGLFALYTFFKKKK